MHERFKDDPAYSSRWLSVPEQLATNAIFATTRSGLIVVPDAMAIGASDLALDNLCKRGFDASFAERTASPKFNMIEL